MAASRSSWYIDPRPASFWPNANLSSMSPLSSLERYGRKEKTYTWLVQTRERVSLIVVYEEVVKGALGESRLDAINISQAFVVVE
jgi:hypothetical protein